MRYPKIEHYILFLNDTEKNLIPRTVPCYVKPILSNKPIDVTN